MLCKRRCAKCREDKCVDDFYVDRRTKDGYRSTCKTCHKRTVACYRDMNHDKTLDYKQWHALTHPQLYRRRTMLQRYGITPEQYDALLVQQGQCCKLCGSTDPRARWGRFHVDHNHSTGRIRGLLCSNCNTGLGKFMDNPDLLRKAANYLEETSCSAG